MNKILTFCKTHNYNILWGYVDDQGTLSVDRKYQTLTPEVIELLSTERLFGAWGNSYVGRFKEQWIGFLCIGDEIMKLQAKTLPDLQDKILNKTATHESTLPRE